MTFTPNSPDCLGMEWQPLHEDRTVMDSPLTPFAATQTSTASETVDTLWLYAVTKAGINPEAYQLDIYEDGDFPSQTITTVTAVPSTDATISGASTWNGSVAGTSSYYLFVSNLTQTPVPIFGGTADDDFIYSAVGGAWSADFRFDGLAALLAGRHISRVRLHAVVQPYAGVGQPASMTVQPYLTINGTPYMGATRTVSGRVPGGHDLVEDWYTNPAELRGWLPADLDQFDQGTATASAGWVVRPTGSQFLVSALLQGDMQVDHAGNDLRVATGHASRADQLAGVLSGWFPITLAQPDGTPGWARVSGTKYRLSWQRQTVTSGGLQLHMLALAGYDPGPVNGWERALVKHRADTRLPYQSDLFDDGRSWAPGAILMVGGSPSVDSQPYIELDEADTGVWTGHELRQYFTTPGALPVTAFSVIRAVIGKRGATATANLTVTLHRSSDDVQMGSSVVLTPTDFDALPDGRLTAFATYRTVVLHMTSAATLATSTRYYLKFLSPAVDEFEGWRIEVARSARFPDPVASVFPANINNATFGGSTDSVRYDGVDLAPADACAIIATLPDPVTGIAAVVQDFTTCIQYVKLTWTPTALGGSFDRYQIQRQDTVASDWVDIALVTTESVARFDDYESIRGKQASYRIRVIRGDTSTSAWSATVTATSLAPCCGYVFTSNVRPDLSVWADDISDGKRPTDRPQNVAVKQFYGRNYQVGFHELENRGSQFTRTLLIAADSAVDGTEPASVTDDTVFNPLFAIARPSEGAGLPYVCVHDESGNRWFATLKTPSTLTQKPGGFYQADVEIIEVTDVPYPPVVED